MTSLLPSVVRDRAPVPASPPPAGGGRGARRRLVPVALVGGTLAALVPLGVCVVLGVTGWFLVDAGAHGTARDGLRYGAVGWLTAHGSGVTVSGVEVTLVPLGLTLLVAFGVWRLATRTGELLAGHGPDADRLADGERDWTVPVAGALFVAGYLAVTALTVVLATGPAPERALLGALGLAALVGVPGVAVGSGRAAVWAGALPAAVPATLAACARVVVTTTVVSCVAVVAALVVGADDVVNVFARLHTGTGEAVTMVVASLAFLPNAAAYAGSWLLGPGFAVGTQTVVSPSLVVLGPVPMFPLLGALPDGGTPPEWSVAALGVPPLVAAVAVARSLRRHPTTRWEQGALRGCAAGVLAGLAVAALAWLAGGVLGPARMSVVGPDPVAVLLHAVPALGLGGLLGGLVATWRTRRQTGHAPAAGAA